MSKFRNPILDKLWEELGAMYKRDMATAKLVETVAVVLCDLDMRLAKLEGVDLITEQHDVKANPETS